ncbi:MAG: hypothetical protein WBG54_14430 [Acidobacteriaceae bacterium]
MSARLIVGVFALVGGSISGIASTVVHLQMVGKVNSILPKERQFAELGWYLPKTHRLHSEYQSLFPAGNLLRRWRIAVVAAVGSLLVCAWGFGFFPF